MKIETLSEDFGAVIRHEPGDDLLARPQQDFIDLFTRYGTLLFRDYSLPVEDFNRFTAQFSTDYMNYKGGGYIRRKAYEGAEETLLSVNYDHGRAQQDTFGIPLHGEMFYSDNRPIVMWFYCAVPAKERGETVVCDGARVYQRLSEPLKRLFRDHKLKYIRRYMDTEWQRIYQTDDIQMAARFARESGLAALVDEQNRVVQTESLQPAVSCSRWGGYTCYINNILTVSWQESMGRKTSLVRLDDDSKLPQQLFDEVNAIQSELQIPIVWKTGDFAMVDNSRALHGRNEFTDPARDIYLRMVRDVPF